MSAAVLRKCWILISITLITGQLVLPKLPQLPSPENFLETLFNVTANELFDIVSHFSFDDILSEDITFLLYNRDGTVKDSKNYFDTPEIKNISEPIKVIIHGWQSTAEHDFIKNMVQSYHTIGIYNIFGVDWSSQSKRNYLFSARGTEKVGEAVGKFIMNLISNDTELLRNVHIIGHSLGAHIAGFAGKHIRNITNGLKVARITGLDAAAPLFEFPIRISNELRLTNEDAEYVDSIHTNVGFLGFLSPFADADFYVDKGGPIQSGCFNLNLFEAFVCSHAKSYFIYNRTITSKNYIATSCGNPFRALANLCDNNQKVVMGEHTTQEATGDYFIDVDSNFLPEKSNVRNPFSNIPELNLLG